MALAQGGSLDDWNNWRKRDQAIAGMNNWPAALGQSPGGLPGAAPIPGTYDPSTGGIPGVTDPAQNLANLLAGITKNIGGIGETIGSLTGASNKALRDQYPDEYFTGLDKSIGNINRRLEGDISDLIPILQQNAAEANIAGGNGQGMRGGLSNWQKRKLAETVLGSSYNVQERALQDLGTYKGLVPTVAPYDANRLIPDINMQTMLQQLADTLRAAPIPGAAANRAEANARAGIRGGFGDAYGGGARARGISSTQSPLQGMIERGAIGTPYRGGIPPVGSSGSAWGGGWGDPGGNNDSNQYGYETWEPGDYQPQQPTGNWGQPWQGGPVYGGDYQQNFNWMNDPFDFTSGATGGSMDNSNNYGYEDWEYFD